MPRSLVRGDYSLVLAIESSSRPGSWYRILADRQSRLLSCDCPVWTFNRRSDEQGNRACPHTDFAHRLTEPAITHTHRRQTATVGVSLLLAAAQQQWFGLHGRWSIEEQDSDIDTKPYHFILLRLELGNGGTATGTVAFANRHHHTTNEMIPGVAGWAGYAIAAEVARLAGYPLMGQLPEHFRVDRRRASQRTRTTPRVVPAAPNFGLADILKVGDIIDQGDGLTPAVRAENTLRMFLGEESYDQLEQYGFLDISSVRYGDRKRVYRLRRDVFRERERRIRVIENGRYVNDFCVIKGQEVPEADHFLTVALHLMSDETGVLNVVQSYNIFQPYSDSEVRETIPAVWHPRNASAIVG